MYEFLKGQLVEITPFHAVIEVGGIGYRLLVPVSHFSRCQMGEKVLFHTSFVVRENFQGLYGFLEREERNLFEVLITLSGVGPKTALSLIGHLPLDAFQSAILTENSKLLAKVPGIGKKTAERLIVDLKGKFLKSDGKSSTKLSSQKVEDAVSALIQLGYNANAAHSAIEKALKECSDDVDTSCLIATALKARI